MSQILSEGILKIKTRSTNALGKQVSSSLPSIKFQLESINCGLFFHKEYIFPLYAWHPCSGETRPFWIWKMCCTIRCPKCGFHAVLNNSWWWMMSKYVFLLNIFVDLFDVQHKAIIAIIFCRFSLEVSCPCLFLRETIQKHSNSFLVLHFRLWHFNSFKAAEVVTIFMTWWKPSHCRHEFPLIRLSWIP